MAKTKTAPHAPPAFVAALREETGGEAPVSGSGRVSHGADVWAWNASVVGYVPQSSKSAAKRNGISFERFALRLFGAGDGDALRYTAHLKGRSVETVYLVALHVERQRVDYAGYTWAPAAGGAS